MRLLFLFLLFVLPDAEAARIQDARPLMGTAVEVIPQELVPFGLNNSTQVVGDVREGRLEGIARCRSRGEREWLWDVEIGPPGSPPSAIATVSIAVRPKRV